MASVVPTTVNDLGFRITHTETRYLTVTRVLSVGRAGASQQGSRFTSNLAMDRATGTPASASHGCAPHRHIAQGLSLDNICCIKCDISQRPARATARGKPNESRNAMVFRAAKNWTPRPTSEHAPQHRELDNERHALMLTRKSALALTAAAAVLAAGAQATPRASAEPVTMAPQVYDKTSTDGWHLNIKINGESVNSVPNLAAAANSREGFVTANATATATGGSNPITDSLFILGYQLGCQSDVSAGLNLGGSGGLGIGGSLIPGTAPTIGPSAGIGGFIQTIVQPGVIVDLPMTNMALSPSGTASLSIDNLHIKADACGGDVTVRSYAYLRVSTEASHTSFAVYGDPIKI